MTETNGTRLVYTAEQAAELLQVSRRTVYELLRTGELRSVKIGKLRRIPLRALEAFLEQGQEEAAAIDTPV